MGSSFLYLGLPKPHGCLIVFPYISCSGLHFIAAKPWANLKTIKAFAERLLTPYTNVADRSWNTNDWDHRNPKTLGTSGRRRFRARERFLGVVAHFVLLHHVQWPIAMQVSLHQRQRNFTRSQMIARNHSSFMGLKIRFFNLSVIHIS